MNQRYVYAMFPNRDQAAEFLYDMWACGEVAIDQKPRIEKHGPAYALTLLCD